MLESIAELEVWLAKGEAMAAEFDAKAKSCRWFWVRRYYRKMAASIRAEMADAIKKWGYAR